MDEETPAGLNLAVKGTRVREAEVVRPNARIASMRWRTGSQSQAATQRARTVVHRLRDWVLVGTAFLT
jgi:hypothetical protein